MFIFHLRISSSFVDKFIKRLAIRQWVENIPDHHLDTAYNIIYNLSQYNFPHKHVKVAVATYISIVFVFEFNNQTVQETYMYMNTLKQNEI